MRQWLRQPRAWICLFSCGIAVAAFVVVTRAHAWLCDDAFISFRYSDNIVSGFGAVFNRGERVEGYTNFLWVLELAVLNWLTGVRLPVGSEVLSITYTVLTILLAIVLAMRPSRAESGRREWTVAVTLALLLTERGFAVWSTSGLETRQFSFFVLLGFALFSEWGGSRGGRIAGSLAFACAELTRPEGLMLGVTGIGCFFLERLVTRRLSLRELVEVAAPAVLVVAAHFLWRRAYYGDWLPNTYYAKHVRPWWDMGMRYITVFSIESGLYLLVPLTIAGAVFRFRRERFGFLVYGLVSLVAECQYVAQIGGDHFEFRPFDLFWVPLSVGAAEALVWFAHAAARRTRAPAFGPVLVAVVALVLWHARVLEFAQWDVAHTRKDRESSVGMVVHMTPEQTPEAFVLPTVAAMIPLYDEWLTTLARHSVGLRHQEHKVFYKLMFGAYGAYHSYDDGHLLPPDAVMAHGNIGAVGYGLRSVTIIDYFGLTDRVIARTPVVRANQDRVMAHDRHPPPGYIESRGLNIWVDPVGASLADAQRRGEFVLELGPQAFMPFNSDKKAWVRGAFAGRRVWGGFFETGAPEATQVWQGATRWIGRSVLGTFDSALDTGWQPTGLNGVQPTASGPQGSQRRVEGAVGAGFLDSFGAQLGDTATGEWLSPEFRPEPGDGLAFLIAGGSGRDAGVSILAAGKEVAVFHGSDDERLRPVLVDLRPYAGQAISVRVYDDARGGWGHVIADQFVVVRAGPIAS